MDDTEREKWRAAVSALNEVIDSEGKMRRDAEEKLYDLQRSIAAALFGAARNDERVPPARVSGAMIDVLAPIGVLVGGSFDEWRSALRKSLNRHYPPRSTDTSDFPF